MTRRYVKPTTDNKLIGKAKLTSPCTTCVFLSQCEMERSIVGLRYTLPCDPVSAWHREYEKFYPGRRVVNAAWIMTAHWKERV